MLSKKVIRNVSANQTYGKVRKNKIGFCLLPIKPSPFNKIFLKFKRRDLGGHSLSEKVSWNRKDLSCVLKE